MYSALTLVMLLAFEGVLAHQRLHSLQMLRAMRKDPYFLYVYRMAKWELLLSDQLLPGDIVSLTSNTTTQNVQGKQFSLKTQQIKKISQPTNLPVLKNMSPVMP